MTKVTTMEAFEKQVNKLASQKNANLFHCYIAGDVFKIATAMRVQEFDFSYFKDDASIIPFLETAIRILRDNLPQQALLFDGVQASNSSRIRSTTRQ